LPADACTAASARHLRAGERSGAQAAAAAIHAVLSNWLKIFVAGKDLPVWGVTEAELGSIKAPTIVIPGNDNTHASTSGIAAHRLIPGSELHRLPIEDQDVPLIPFPDWAPYEDEIAQVLARFIARVSASARAAE